MTDPDPVHVDYVIRSSEVGPEGINLLTADEAAALLRSGADTEAAAPAPTDRLRTDQVAQWDAPDVPDLTGRLTDTEPERKPEPHDHYGPTTCLPSCPWYGRANAPHTTSRPPAAPAPTEAGDE